ncbi:MAG: PAC2 family protein [Candidatus Helarchaeota archaeon]|nr:PAC2 family protein [Candidatus Helarchaeota archaeon]
MIKLKEYTDIPDLRSPLVLIGMPGIALVGKLATLSIINSDSLKCSLYGEIYYHDFPPHVIINKAEIKMPKIVIYTKKLPDSYDHDLIVITGDYQPTTSLGIYALSDFICKLCKKFDTYLIVSMGAFVPETMGSKRQVYISSTQKKWIDFFLKSSTETTVILKGGYISGANGIIPAWSAIHYDIPGVCILADAMPLLQIDPAGSKELVRVINALFELKIDEDLLDRRIEEIESMTSEFLELMQKRRDEKQKPQPYIG